jgi:NAD(P)-dependent dehydrogenase (short-subunit alcohol dehydrogenase family)
MLDRLLRGRRSLRGRVVLITGASGGIGAALARRFRREGCRLVLLDLELSALERLRDELQAPAEDVLLSAGDITDETATSEAVSQAIARFGGIDVLINNAGITHRSLLLETSPAVIRRVVEVNFLGSVYVTMAALPSLVERRGSIVVMSSIAGFAPLVGRCGYAASKHALHGFFETLRAEVGSQGVDVLLACPWYVDTPIRTNALGGDGAPVKTEKALSGPLLTPDRAADLIVQAITDRRRLYLFPFVAEVSFWMAHLLPRLYERLMKNSVRSEFRV